MLTDAPRSTSSTASASGCAPTADQLGHERLTVGDRSFAVGDVVVLGANARGRLGVVNGTTAIIQDLDLRGRAMTVQTLEEEPPKTVRLPGWYLDAAVRPGQSRRGGV